MRSLLTLSVCGLDMRSWDGFAGIYDGDTIGASIIGNRITTWVIHSGVKQCSRSTAADALAVLLPGLTTYAH